MDLMFLKTIIQAHISNKLIKYGSLLNMCGYKRTHPLEANIIHYVYSIMAD